ncbi:MAG TPA: putative DNA binding domain-containing protein [Syntrophorhabdaceae bacterium]|nr:putative DNA binding domain-containing protein [Syntrophorhabdaceae bacterium]HON84492.1 putative DNA binding domain-containing protein [Syntrophorhabdaceae bacterium]HPC65706.1 putative DNA binding domain-containing protein [Syntrophorhabdaceae bacterium]HQE79924.1 putative DNA binding domain-containing protein [Syntrophorhabdaceae bacterium]HQK45671.1 putative DNA binding domain-containing protein [Syntrophorhabdaceae bacterium]
MKKEELKLILKEGEGYKIEFKESINSLDKEMVAFANSSGGRILVGVTDSGQPKGIVITNKLKSQIQDIANNCRPKPFISLEEIENILVINVREGTDKPYECSSGFFKRIGPNSQKMSRNEIIEVFKSEGKIRFDELIETKFNYPKDFDKDKLKRFLKLAEISRVDDVEKILISLGVAEKQEGRLYFNNTGILFFAKEPQRFIPWSVFTVALFKDTAGVDIIDRKEIEGSLFEIVEEVMRFVRLYTKVAYRFTGKPQRENIYEYPFDAIREAVINSVMHKYYFEHGHNNILRFLPDRIKIENYWQMPSHFVFGKTVFRRNQIIADLFSKIHFGEKMGTGFERIRQICKRENAPFPKVEFNENYFYVTFKQSYEYLKFAGISKAADRPVEKTVEKTVEKILELIQANPQITQKEIMFKTGLTRRGVEWNLKKLKEAGLITRIGPDRGGYWKIIKK